MMIKGKNAYLESFYALLLAIIILVCCTKRDAQSKETQKAIGTRQEILLNDSNFLNLAAHIRGLNEEYRKYAKTLNRTNLQVLKSKINQRDSIIVKKFASFIGYNLKDYFTTIHNDAHLLNSLIKTYGDTLVGKALCGMISDTLVHKTGTPTCENYCFINYQSCQMGAYQNYLWNIGQGAQDYNCCYDVGQDTSCCVDAWYSESWAYECYVEELWQCSNDNDNCSYNCYNGGCCIILP